MARMIMIRSAMAAGPFRLAANAATAAGSCARPPVSALGSRLSTSPTNTSTTCLHLMISMVRTADPAGRSVRSRCLSSYTHCQQLEEWPTTVVLVSSHRRQQSPPTPPQPQILRTTCRISYKYRYLSSSGGSSSNPDRDWKETTTKREEEHNDSKNDDANAKERTYVFQETVYERDAEEEEEGANRTDQEAFNAKVADPSTYTVEIPIRMPEIGDGHEGGSIVKWYKQVGDVVQYGDVLCDIETKNFTFGMQTEDECLGIVKELCVPEGSSMAENETICVLLHEPDEGAAPPSSSSTPQPTPVQDDDDEDDDETDAGTDADSNNKK